MSFTVAVKEEILGQHHLSRHELAAIIKMSGSIGLSSSGLTLSVVTENAKLARHLYESFLHFYGIKSEIRHHHSSLVNSLEMEKRSINLKSQKSNLMKQKRLT